MVLLDTVKSLIDNIPNTRVFLGSKPSTPDSVVVIYLTGGMAKGLTESHLARPTFQVRVRANTYTAGIAMCEAIDAVLHGYTGAQTLLIQNMGYINDLGRDENNRPEFTMNYTAYYLD